MSARLSFQQFDFDRQNELRLEAGNSEFPFKNIGRPSTERLALRTSRGVHCACFEPLAVAQCFWMKLPAIQFYPADWRKDPAVQSLSYHHRGIWFEIICLMHESEQRGKLLLNGKKMPDEALARLLGLDKQILTTALTTFLELGVASLCSQTGALINRRMVRDEEIRKIRQNAGKLGGNPALLKQKSTTLLKQIPTPSASTSVATSSSNKDSPPISGEHAAFIKGWCENFKSRFQVDYKVDGGRDGKAVKELLSMNVLRIDLLEIAKKAWLSDSFNCRQAQTIHGYRNYFNQINLEVKNGKPNQNTFRHNPRNAGIVGDTATLANKTVETLKRREAQANETLPH